MASRRNPSLIVVGSGFFGATISRLAADDGYQVLVIEKRNHLGGNAHSYFDEETGIEVHQYGSHLFHTSNPRVWDFVGGFTEFNDYRHHVYTNYQGQVFSMPVNLHTISQFFGRSLTPREAEALLEANGRHQAEGAARDLEEKAIASVGHDLYSALIRGYTLKQWGRDPRDLPASTISRLPVRLDYNSRYFSDRWEGLPKIGYGPLFGALFGHEKIEVRTDTDYFDVRSDLPKESVTVYTGPIDRYFDFRFGPLGWRTLDFLFETHETPDFQGTAVMNFAEAATPYTRVHEFKHLHPERVYRGGKSVTATEYSREAQTDDEPYYPVNSNEDRAKLEQYRALIQKQPVFFGGRLGSYQYLDMHMAIASAISLYEGTLAATLRGA